MTEFSAEALDEALDKLDAAWAAARDAQFKQLQNLLCEA